MNQDGTGQQEYYGNNTRDPKSFQIARSLPGSDKVLCVTGGYHTCQGGKLVVMDVRKGRQGFSGICAVPSGKPLEIKKALGENFSQEGDLYQSPYPVTADGFLISYSPLGGHLFPDGVIHTHRIEPRVRYNLYWMTLDGRRELLAADPDTSCLQGVPLMKRKRPQSRASTVDYRKPSGTLFVQDVYYGLGLKGIAPGTVKKLRVVEIAYKPCTIGGVMAKGGKGGSGHSVTPPAQASGTYDVKIIHGDTEVYADGSAWVNVPARKPLYLQALDDKNRVIQTMRSWLTLMPNENFSCSGCHEDKNSPPLPASRVSIAMQHGPVDLKPFYGPPRGFSFTAEIQPILDRHCVRCHHPEGKNKNFLLDRAILRDSTEEKGSGGGNAHRLWLRSYGTLTEIDLKNQYMNYRDHSKWLAWFGRLDEPDLLPPGRTGSVKATLLPFLEKGHNQVRLSTEELDKLAAWMDLGIPFCGDYFEANDWDSGQLKHYEMRMTLRQKMAAIEQANIKEWILREPTPAAR
jgi:cytochrome c553